MGMAGFYRKFISDFAALTRPLNDLLKKGVKVKEEWSQQHSDAVAKIKLAMTTYPVLRQYDPKRQLHLVTDASDLAVGACIYQFDAHTSSHALMFQGIVSEVGKVALSSVRQRLLVLRPLQSRGCILRCATIGMVALIPVVHRRGSLIYNYYFVAHGIIITPLIPLKILNL